MAEIELTVIQIRHTGQALTEGVQANHIGIHLSDAHGQGIDLFLQDALGILDLGLLVQEFSRPIAQLIDGIAATMPGAQAHADGECGAHDCEHQQHGSTT